MSIRFRKDRKKFELAITIDGKRKRLLFDTKREALEGVTTTNAEKTSITIDEAIKHYYKNVSCTKSKASHVSEKKYFNLMFHFLTEERGLKYLSQVRYGHMISLQSWLQEPRVYKGKEMKWSPATANRAFNSIKALFVYFVRDGEILASPCAHLKTIQAPDNSRRPMTKDEFIKAIGHAPDWFKPIMLFTHLTASPPSCVERLRWSDVDEVNHTLTLTRRKGAQGKWRRVPHPLTQALSDLFFSQKREHDFVFSNEFGLPINADRISKVGNKAIKEAGLKGVVLYSMRHSLASDLTDANVNMEIIRQLMGHANIRTTQRYAKPQTESLERALKLVRG